MNKDLLIAEIQSWRERYEALLKVLANNAALHKPPLMLAEAESYEAGRLMGAAEERKACAEHYLAIMRAAVAAEREACAKEVGWFAKRWWSIHCATNKHMETTRKAHDDFCALQATIRVRGGNAVP